MAEDNLCSFFMFVLIKLTLPTFILLQLSPLAPIIYPFSNPEHFTSGKTIIPVYFQGRKKKSSISFLVIFPCCWPTYPPSKIVSHPKDKKLTWPLHAHQPSKEGVCTWLRKNYYSRFHSVRSYISRLRYCSNFPNCRRTSR